MAMLILPEVFERTWGCARRHSGQEHRTSPPPPSGLLLLAEVYWDLEWTLQQQGFDYTYDKRLYDRLREGHARPVREHFYAATRLPEQAGHVSWRTTTNHGLPPALSPGA